MTETPLNSRRAQFHDRGDAQCSTVCRAVYLICRNRLKPASARRLIGEHHIQACTKFSKMVSENSYLQLQKRSAKRGVPDVGDTPSRMHFCHQWRTPRG
jgi:hypothetical protein